MGSENESEAGHLTDHHANHTDSDNKDCDNNEQFHLDICTVLSWSSLFARIIHEAFFAVEYVAAFKTVCFSHMFSEWAL